MPSPVSRPPQHSALGHWYGSIVFSAASILRGGRRTRWAVFLRDHVDDEYGLTVMSIPLVGVRFHRVSANRRGVWWFFAGISIVVSVDRSLNQVGLLAGDSQTVYALVTGYAKRYLRSVISTYWISWSEIVPISQMVVTRKNHAMIIFERQTQCTVVHHNYYC